ncbi:MAG TPA: hypothetical protein VMH22_13305 [bacterium]|nr:hypothetical protein [bacterium]
MSCPSVARPASRDLISSPVRNTARHEQASPQFLDRLDQNREVFLSGDYKEEQLRLEFLNPFFTGLGWDMCEKGGSS